jgi:nitroreductase
MLERNITSRKSVVCFDSRLVEIEKLKLIFEAASLAPSSYNYQPWRFIVGLKGTDTYNKIFSSLTESNSIWAAKVPVLMVSVAETIIASKNRPNKFAIHDTGMAYATMVIQAIALGLSSHPMGGFSPELITENFKLPAGFEPVLAAAIGYEGDCQEMPEEVKIRSQRPRSRKNIDEFVFGNDWDSSFFKEQKL